VASTNFVYQRNQSGLNDSHHSHNSKDFSLVPDYNMSGTGAALAFNRVQDNLSFPFIFHKTSDKVS
jgi:hypothetical protein